MTALTTYLEVSGADPSVREQFNAIELPKLSSDPSTATVQVKETVQGLFGKRFYNIDAFTLQDVLRTKSGNCLGLPLLIACLLRESGYDPKLRVVVAPHDKVHELEQSFFERITTETQYHKPVLATQRQQVLFRCAPLEHLILDVDGKLIETTTEDNKPTACEVFKPPMTFEQALSYVLKDRAVQTDHTTAKTLARKGLLLWDKNAQLYTVLMSAAQEDFDDETHDAAEKRFLELPDEDSLHCYEKYLVTRDPRCLDAALQKYTSFAQALARKAQWLTDKDPAEAKFLFGIASQLYAQSHLLDITDFYSTFADELAHLFGKEPVQIVLSNARHKARDFDRNLTLYKLTGNSRYLQQAQLAAKTPRQQVLFLQTAKGTPLYDPSLQRELDAQFSNSKLYKQLTLKETN